MGTVTSKPRVPASILTGVWLDSTTFHSPPSGSRRVTVTGSGLWFRTLISKAYTLVVNIITRRRLKYYNGLQIHRAPVLKSLRIQSSGYGFQSEVLVKSLRRTRTVIEVPMDLIEREKGESKAFRLKNVADVLRTVGILCAEQWGRHA